MIASFLIPVLPAILLANNKSSLSIRASTLLGMTTVCNSLVFYPLPTVPYSSSQIGLIIVLYLKPVLDLGLLLAGLLPCFISLVFSKISA